MLALLERHVVGLVRVPPDEVLQQQLRVLEVRGVVLVGLSVAPGQGLLEVGGIPDPLGHGLALEQGLSLLDQLVGSHLDVLVEEVAPQHLLTVFKVDHVREDPGQAEGRLGHEGKVLVVEECSIVVEEEEGDAGAVDEVLLVEWVVDVQVGHVVVPLRIIRVQEHALKRESGPDPLDDVQQVHHLLHTLVALVPHAPVHGEVSVLEAEQGHGREVSLHKIIIPLCNVNERAGAAGQASVPAARISAADRLSASVEDRTDDAVDGPGAAKGRLT